MSAIQAFCLFFGFRVFYLSNGGKVMAQLKVWLGGNSLNQAERMMCEELLEALEMASKRGVVAHPIFPIPGAVAEEAAASEVVPAVPVKRGPGRPRKVVPNVS